MQRVPGTAQHRLHRHLPGQGVLERVLQLREEARLVQELGRLERAPGRACSSSSGASAIGPAAAGSGTSLPITAAVWSSRFSSGGRRSMRAARTAWTVAGTRMRLQRPAPAGRRRARRPAAPVSTSDRTLSSRKNGLPSVRSISSALSAAARRRRRLPAAPTSSSSALSAASGSIRSWV